MKGWLIGGFLMAIALPVGAQTLAVTGATIIDGTGESFKEGVLLIEDGRIAAVGSLGSVRIPESAVRIDAQGKYVIPGLMDANLHL